MSSEDIRFFGVPIVKEGREQLADAWGRQAVAFRVLVCGGRRLLWRLVRSRHQRDFLQACGGRFLPVHRASRRQVRIATGERVDSFAAFKAAVRILARAEQDKASIYLIERGPRELQRLEQNVRATFPDLHVVGRTVFHPSKAEPIATAIRKAAPRIVFLGYDRRAPLLFLSQRSTELGPTTVLVSRGASSRMIGMRRGISGSLLESVVVWPFMWLPLLIHRLSVHRRKRIPAS